MYPGSGFAIKARDVFRDLPIKPVDLSYCAVITKAGEGRIGYLWLDLELRPLYARLPQYGIMFGVVTLSLAAVAVMPGFALKHGVSMPITGLAATARSVIERRDYGLRAAGIGKDGIGRLTEAFNRMLEGIEARDNSLRNSEERFSKAFLASPIPISIVRVVDDVFWPAASPMISTTCSRPSWVTAPWPWKACRPPMPCTAPSSRSCARGSGPKG